MSHGDDRKDFHRWKFRVQRAILMDPLLEPNAVRVALCLLEHANPRGDIFPSQETLGDQANLSERQVRKLIGKLSAVGWISSQRENRRGGNQYQFLDRNLHRVEAHQRSLQEARKAKRTGTNEPLNDADPAED